MRQLDFAVLAMTTFLSFSVLSVALSVSPVQAQGSEPIVITLENDKFTPSEVSVPTGRRFRLKIVNKSPAAIEFESKQLKIEKVMPAGSEAIVSVRPVKAGRYLFVNEYKEETVKGYLIAK